MSALKGVVAGLFLALILAVAGLLYWNHHQTVKSAQTSIELSEAKTSINQLDTSLKVNDEVVTGTVKVIKANVQKRQEILQEVDNTTKRVDNEEITSADADAVYIDSMWSAYCTYHKGESDCTTRQSPSSLHNG
jgi:uncharacterized membrane protein YvbJ